mmetsp:Transcript_28011/g.70926  ORF Transcript_28011/g.70926 Transcript_28011/m.70926 type:complete len:96 (+) Transcript_28011:4115-4402(+)
MTQVPTPARRLDAAAGDDASEDMFVDVSGSGTQQYKTSGGLDNNTETEGQGGCGTTSSTAERLRLKEQDSMRMSGGMTASSGPGLNLDFHDIDRQ